MKRLLMATALLLTACATTPDGTATRRYMCADGTSFFARYHQGGVVLDFGSPGGSMALAPEPGAAPGVYGRAGEEFRVSADDEATLLRTGHAPVTCRRGDVRDMAIIR